jgi:hypothetical protein
MFAVGTGLGCSGVCLVDADDYKHGEAISYAIAVRSVWARTTLKRTVSAACLGTHALCAAVERVRGLARVYQDLQGG